jgi:DNA polymerase-1
MTDISNFKLPQVRKLFLPDKGKILIDCDLSGADAQVVAWEADEKELKDAFRAGLNVHNYNGQAVWGDAYVPNAKRVATRAWTMRDEIKRATHGTNYGASARTLAGTLGWTIREAEEFQAKWFSTRPGIKRWHERTEFELQTTRTISNAFGYRIVYFDRVDGLLPEALAWKPQSTIGIVCAQGGTQVYKNLPWVEFLLQVHDSLVFQIPFHKFTPSNLAIIKDHLDVEVPYPDPLHVPWELSASDKNWAECTKRNWDGSEKSK